MPVNKNSNLKQLVTSVCFRFVKLPCLIMCVCTGNKQKWVPLDIEPPKDRRRGKKRGEGSASSRKRAPSKSDKSQDPSSPDPSSDSAKGTTALVAVNTN